MIQAHWQAQRIYNA